jgi:muramoyltetrapeptide carboxypeptidase
MNVEAGVADDFVLMPPKLKTGDKVRFISPASTPDKAAVLQRAKILEGWGLKVDFGEHAFHKLAYLAGTDDERLCDLNLALRDPEVRAALGALRPTHAYHLRSNRRS